MYVRGAQPPVGLGETSARDCAHLFAHTGHVNETVKVRMTSGQFTTAHLLADESTYATTPDVGLFSAMSSYNMDKVSDTAVEVRAALYHWVHFVYRLIYCTRLAVSGVERDRYHGNKPSLLRSSFYQSNKL
jgi:hypothetical protein